MSWSSKTQNGVGSVPSQELDSTRDELLPLADREARSGDKPFEPIDFQPVKSPGHFEAEFALKGNDVIFHFWPWGFHEAQERGAIPPRFLSLLPEYLAESLSKEYGSKAQLSADEDMGALFVRVPEAGINQFWREIAIKVCEHLHNCFES